MRMNVRIEATAVIRTQTVQIPMVHTLACVVAVIVEMGTIALVSAFTGMRDNTQNALIYIYTSHWPHTVAPYLNYDEIGLQVKILKLMYSPDNSSTDTHSMFHSACFIIIVWGGGPN